VTSRQGIALLCLAVLCLAVLTPAASDFLWLVVLPLCFVFSLAVVSAWVIDTERERLVPDFSALLPARAPPVLS
jgi:hypothetical protein